MFLNNAVNHGIFTPLRLQQVTTNPNTGSFFLLLEPNPGQELGLLLTFYFFAKSNDTKTQALSAAPIQFIGGIHEIYFPCVLMKPFTIIFMILGGIFNVVVYQIFDVGSIAINSPGSVIAIYTFILKSSYLGLTIAVFGSALLVFTLTSFYLIFERQRNGERVFYNPVLAWLNARYNKLILVDILAINRKREFKSIEYVSHQTKAKFKFEHINFQNGKKVCYILNLSDQEVVQFAYFKRKKATYLVKLFVIKKNVVVQKWLNDWKLAIFKHLKKQSLLALKLNKLQKFHKLVWSKVDADETANPILSVFIIWCKIMLKVMLNTRLLILKTKFCIKNKRLILIQLNTIQSS